MFTKFLLCFFMILFAALDGYAQDRFDSWTTDNGLPQNQINGIIQTRDGYLWLTTFNGLVRYDGARFKVLLAKDRQSPVARDRVTRRCDD